MKERGPKSIYGTTDGRHVLRYKTLEAAIRQCARDNEYADKWSARHPDETPLPRSNFLLLAPCAGAPARS